ncbi:MAG: YfhO family protein [Anaerolineaceae bacterium]|nr:MAG: YfhO family protein [Anaerolineaceae bacterium]
MSTIKAKHLPIILVVLGPLILFGPMLLRGEALFWGTPLLQFVPWREFAFQTLSEGYLPLWNPQLGMGAPLFANYQSALLYPPNVLLVITGSAWGHGLLVTLHLMWAGIGMVVLTRRLGLGFLGQTVSALAFGLSGYLVARGGFLSINAAVAWLPWILLTVDRLGKCVEMDGWSRDTIKATLWFSAALALQWLAGHAQTAWYTFLIACTWACWMTIRSGGWNGLKRLSVHLIGAAVLAFGLSAVQLLPTVEYLLNSHRVSYLDPEFALTYSFWPWRLLDLFLPGLFGNPAQGNYWGYGNYWEDAIYVGILPFILALIAIWRGLRGKDQASLIRFLLGLALIAFIFALGKNTPIFPLLFRHVPTFNLFQAPSRWNLILIFVLAMLAGIGAEYLRPPTGRTLYWTRLGTVGAAVVGFAAWIGSLLIEGVEPSFIRAFTVSGFWLFVAGVIILKVPEGFSWKWVVIVGLVVLTDLAYAGFGLNPSVPLSVFRGDSALKDIVADEHRVYMPSDVEYQLKFKQTHRFDTFNPDIDWRIVRDIGLPNTPILNDIASANNFDPLLPDRYVQWTEMIEEASPDHRLNLLTLMDVGWLAVLDPGSDLGVRYEAVPGAERIRMVSEAVVVSSAAEALSIVSKPDFDPMRIVVLEDDTLSSLPSGGGGEFILIENSDPSVVNIRVETTEGSWLLLSDTWYPGWSVELDGAETKLYKADFLFRAVWVPPGTHSIEFRYRSPLFFIGAVLSVLGWLAMAGIGWRWRKLE